jgi:hypothetical protein
VKAQFNKEIVGWPAAMDGFRERFDEQGKQELK